MRRLKVLLIATLVIACLLPLAHGLPEPLISDSVSIPSDINNPATWTASDWQKYPLTGLTTEQLNTALNDGTLPVSRYGEVDWSKVTDYSKVTLSDIPDDKWSGVDQSRIPGDKVSQIPAEQFNARQVKKEFLKAATAAQIRAATINSIRTVNGESKDVGFQNLKDANPAAVREAFMQEPLSADIDISDAGIANIKYVNGMLMCDPPSTFGSVDLRTFPQNAFSIVFSNDAVRIVPKGEGRETTITGAALVNMQEGQLYVEPETGRQLSVNGEDAIIRIDGMVFAFQGSGTMLANDVFVMQQPSHVTDPLTGRIISTFGGPVSISTGKRAPNYETLGGEVFFEHAGMTMLGRVDFVDPSNKLHITGTQGSNVLLRTDGQLTATGFVQIEDPVMYYRSLKGSTLIDYNINDPAHKLRIDNPRETGDIAALSEKVSIADLATKDVFGGPQKTINTIISKTQTSKDTPPVWDVRVDKASILSALVNDPLKFVQVPQIVVSVGPPAGETRPDHDYLRDNFLVSDGTHGIIYSPGTAEAAAIIPPHKAYAEFGLKDTALAMTQLVARSAMAIQPTTKEGKEQWATLKERAAETTTLLADEAAANAGESRGAQCELAKFSLEGQFKLPSGSSTTQIARVTSADKSYIEYRIETDANGKESITGWRVSGPLTKQTTWSSMETAREYADASELSEAQKNILISASTTSTANLRFAAAKEQTLQFTDASPARQLYDGWYASFSDTYADPALQQQAAALVAQRHLTEGRPEAALDYYQNVAATDPNSAAGQQARKVIGRSNAMYAINAEMMLTQSMYQTNKAEFERAGTVYADPGKFYDQLVEMQWYEGGFAALSGINPFKLISKDVLNLGRTADLEKDVGARMGALRYLQKMVDRGATLEEAIRYARKGEIPAEYYQRNGEPLILPSEASIAFMTDPKKSPALHGGIALESAPYDPVVREAMMYDAAKKYRKDGEYQAAAMMLDQLRQSSDPAVAQRAQKLFNEIVDPNSEWLNFADATKRAMYTDMPIELINPFGLALNSVAFAKIATVTQTTKAGSAVIGSYNALRGLPASTLGLAETSIPGMIITFATDIALPTIATEGIRIVNPTAGGIADIVTNIISAKPGDTARAEARQSIANALKEATFTVEDSLVLGSRSGRIVSYVGKIDETALLAQGAVKTGDNSWRIASEKGYLYLVPEGSTLTDASIGAKITTVADISSMTDAAAMRSLAQKSMLDNVMDAYGDGAVARMGNTAQGDITPLGHSGSLLDLPPLEMLGIGRGATTVGEFEEGLQSAQRGIAGYLPPSSAEIVDAIHIAPDAAALFELRKNIPSDAVDPTMLQEALSMFPTGDQTERLRNVMETAVSGTNVPAELRAEWLKQMRTYANDIGETLDISQASEYSLAKARVAKGEGWTPLDAEAYREAARRDVSKEWETTINSIDSTLPLEEQAVSSMTAWQKANSRLQQEQVATMRSQGDLPPGTPLHATTGLSLDEISRYGLEPSDGTYGGGVYGMVPTEKDPALNYIGRGSTTSEGALVQTAIIRINEEALPPGVSRSPTIGNEVKYNGRIPAEALEYWSPSRKEWVPVTAYDGEFKQTVVSADAAAGVENIQYELASGKPLAVIERDVVTQGGSLDNIKSRAAHLQESMNLPEEAAHAIAVSEEQLSIQATQGNLITGVDATGQRVFGAQIGDTILVDFDTAEDVLGRPITRKQSVDYTYGHEVAEAILTKTGAREALGESKERFAELIGMESAGIPLSRMEQTELFSLMTLAEQAMPAESAAILNQIRSGITGDLLLTLQRNNDLRGLAHNVESVDFTPSFVAELQRSGAEFARRKPVNELMRELAVRDPAAFDARVRTLGRDYSELVSELPPGAAGAQSRVDLAEMVSQDAYGTLQKQYEQINDAVPMFKVVGSYDPDAPVATLTPHPTAQSGAAEQAAFQKYGASAYVRDKELTAAADESRLFVNREGAIVDNTGAPATIGIKDEGAAWVLYEIQTLEGPQQVLAIMGRGSTKVPHPVLAEGNNVLAAGEMGIDNGKVSWVDSSTGHYYPSNPAVQKTFDSQVIKEFQNYMFAQKKNGLEPQFTDTAVLYVGRRPSSTTP